MPADRSSATTSAPCVASHREQAAAPQPTSRIRRPATGAEQVGVGFAQPFGAPDEVHLAQEVAVLRLVRVSVPVPPRAARGPVGIGVDEPASDTGLAARVVVFGHDVTVRGWPNGQTFSRISACRLTACAGRFSLLSASSPIGRQLVACECRKWIAASVMSHRTQPSSVDRNYLSSREPDIGEGLNGRHR